MIPGLTSLRARLMLLMLAAALPAFAVIGYLAHWQRELHEARYRQTTLTLARALANEHEKNFDQARLLLAALARHPALNDAQDCRALLADIHARSPRHIANLVLANPDGGIRCHAKPFERPLTVAHMAWFRAALDADGPHVEGYHPSQCTGAPTIVVSHTLRANGRAVAVLAAALDLSWLARQPYLAGLPAGAAYGILDNAGNRLLRFPNAPHQAERNIADTAFWRTLGRLDRAATFRAADPHGIERLFAYAPLGPAQRPHARLVVGVPAALAGADAERVMWIGAAGLAGAMALGLILGWQGSRRWVLKPLQPIFDTVSRVAAGNLSARTGVPPSFNEISQLAAEVDAMASALEERELAARQQKAEQERLREQLQQAQKMEALGQLTGGIAHDFNNMLATILGFSKLALQRHVPDKDAPLAEYLTEVVAAGERARDLVAKMLAYGRMRPNQMSCALDPKPLVKEIMKMLAATLPASIRIDQRIDADTPDIAIDPVALQQILMNLVINARDAMDGRGELSLRLGTVDQPPACCTVCHRNFAGAHVELTVTDTGPGVAPDVLPRIFEPFFTTKAVGKGTGMGLAMVLGLVRQAGGHILVESPPGRGATFRILFPLAQGAAAAPADAPTPAPPAPPAAPGVARVLVVDDEPMILRMLTALLEAAGHRVSAFGDPRAALARIEVEPAAFDVVITDETMPGMTGAELAAAIGKLRPELPVILCTGHSDRLDEATALSLGVRRFFQKPVDPDALLAALAEVRSKG